MYQQEVLPSADEFFMTAIWDTGATASAISRSVVEFLGLSPTGNKELISSANGIYESDTYLVDLYLSEDIVFKDLLVTEIPKDSRLLVIVGLDVILQSDFLIESTDDSFTFEFSYPPERNRKQE